MHSDYILVIINAISEWDILFYFQCCIQIEFLSFILDATIILRQSYNSKKYLESIMWSPRPSIPIIYFHSVKLQLDEWPLSNSGNM